MTKQQYIDSIQECRNVTELEGLRDLLHKDDDISHEDYLNVEEVYKDCKNQFLSTDNRQEEENYLTDDELSQW